jgi:hypothetical protein
MVISCNIELSPYTGNGRGPPLCGAPVVLNRMCERHVRIRVDELNRSIEKIKMDLSLEQAELTAITTFLARKP